MPDILIRRMDKPGSCRECDFCEVQDINFETLYFCNRNDRFLDDEEACNIPNDCPIIKLPEHGDLIDLSELQKFPIRLDHYDKEHGDEHFVYGIESLMEYAECLPVVIPAEKGE